VGKGRVARAGFGLDGDAGGERAYQPPGSNATARERWHGLLWSFAALKHGEGMGCPAGVEPDGSPAGVEPDGSGRPQPDEKAEGGKCGEGMGAAPPPGDGGQEGSAGVTVWC